MYANFSSCSIYNIDLNVCKSVYANFSGCSIYNVDLDICKSVYANFSRSRYNINLNVWSIVLAVDVYRVVSVIVDVRESILERV